VILNLPSCALGLHTHADLPLMSNDLILRSSYEGHSMSSKYSDSIFLDKINPRDCTVLFFLPKIPERNDLLAEKTY